MYTYLNLRKLPKLTISQYNIGKKIDSSLGCKLYKREVIVKLLKEATCYFATSLP